MALINDLSDLVTGGNSSLDAALKLQTQKLLDQKFAVPAAYLAWVDPDGTTQTLYFDAVMSIMHEGVSEVTTHPVERGPDITDRVQHHLRRVSLEVFVSNAPLKDSNQVLDAKQTQMKLEYKLYVPPLATFSPFFLANPHVLIAKAGITGLNAIESFIFKKKTASANVLKFGKAEDLPSRTFDILDTQRQKATLFSVIAREKSYSNMVLTEVQMKAKKEDGTGRTFELKFQELNVVETASVKAPVPAKPAASPETNKGKASPNKPPGRLQSVALAGANKAGANLALTGGALVSP